MALHDIVGKLRDVPVWKLFGGRFRDKVPVSYCMGDKPAEEAAKEAEEAVKRGFKAIKMKGWNAEEDVVRIKAVAEAAGPEVGIRIDANTGWERPSVVVKLAKQIENYNIESFESPIPQWNLDAYALLRQQINIPIMLHLSAPFEVVNAVKKEACDYINFGELASFYEVRTAAAIAPCDLIGNFLHEDDLVVEPIKIRDGYIEVSEKPGLGIELDEKAIEKYTVRKKSFP